ncbi:hypothetical protein Cylst_4095 [Cylindrospermum stagnale PCC 7417]|uniref:Uncharacterized protein n=1 Tax=Cylindrospermum stagnale PCC 7417 TaxID=56107 RepID=K9X3C2_9NOST|nr:hypothetical protein [Cylindrospermum stagnale]AFZ26202.1 hypothetical protein Cylst_4095 [Cylindrospermum stagnale PCC 7417]
MTIARQHIASLEIKLDDSQNVNLSRLWKLVRLGESQLQRVFWHSQAYGTIFGVLLLTVVSLIFLGINWAYRRLFATPRAVGTNEWDISGNN